MPPNTGIAVEPLHVVIYKDAIHYAPGVLIGTAIWLAILNHIIQKHLLPLATWIRDKGDHLEQEIVAWKTIQAEANSRLRNVEGQFGDMVKSLDGKIDALTDAIRRMADDSRK